MKKSFISILVILFAMLLTGCSDEYIKITDSESEAIAQYCAHLLLKYDGNKNDDMRLMEYDDFIDEMEARRPSPTEAVPEEPGDNEDDADVTEDSELQPDGNEESDIHDSDVSEGTDISEEVSPTEAVTPTPEPTPIPEPVVYSLSEVFGFEEDFLLEYVSTETVEEYQDESEYFSLNAPEGKVIAAVAFTLKNISEEEKAYEASSYPIKLKLSCANNQNYDPALSLLTDDLQFYNGVFAAGEEKAVKLIFFIPTDTYPGTLKVSGKGSETESKSCTIYISNNSEVENGN